MHIMTARLFAAAAIAGAGVQSAGAVSIFTDRAAFETSVGGPLVTETFDSDIATADSITFDRGIVATKSSSGVPPTLNRVALGQYTGFVQRDGFRDVTFDFATPSTAFGGDFSGLSSLTVAGGFDGEGTMTISISDQIAGPDGFFGLVGEAPVSAIVFSTEAGAILGPGAPPIGGETFSLDNFSISPIPLPATLPLLAGALGVVAAIGRASRSRDRA